jgi:hypothetical protein
VYDPSTNVETIFNHIQDFQDICGLLNKAKTDTQLVDTAYFIFQKSGLFRDSLNRWNKLPDPAKKFQDFKVFMRSEYLDLQEVGGMTLASSNLNTINIVQELKQHHEDVVSDLKRELAENFIETLKTMNMSEETENQHPNVQSYVTPANYNAPTVGQEQTMFSAVQSNQDPVLQQLLAQMAQMQQKIENLTLTNNGSKKKSRANRNLKNSASPTDKINPKTGRQWRRYCWSCGCCDHWSRDCTEKKSGHKDNATFRNRMEGSDKDCF